MFLCNAFCVLSLVLLLQFSVLVLLGTDASFIALRTFPAVLL